MVEAVPGRAPFMMSEWKGFALAVRLELLVRDQTLVLCLKAALTSEFRRQWKRKMNSPCRELSVANMYWKTTAQPLTASTPKTHEVPRMGSSTATALAVNLERNSDGHPEQQEDRCRL